MISELYSLNPWVKNGQNLKATSDQKEENREIREEIDMLKECMLNSKGEELAPIKREFLLIYWLVHSYHVIYLH